MKIIGQNKVAIPPSMFLPGTRVHPYADAHIYTPGEHFLATGCILMSINLEGPPLLTSKDA
eukprot:1160905-Pelagomonas_calceolata.AAC.7